MANTTVGTGLDANGWTTFAASADTRIIYVSSSTGSDSNNGLSQNTAVATIDKGLSLIRDGSADWLLLKAGDTWVNQEFGHLSFSGRSGTEPILISSYGDGARPLILTDPNSGTAAIGSMKTDGSNIAIVGLEFYAHTRDPGNPNFAGPGQQIGMDFNAPLNNLLVENCKFSFYEVNAIQSHGAMAGNVIVRRSIITDNYSTEGHSQGLYVYNVANLVVEQNLFDHNGWNSSVAGAEATIFNHNLYLAEENGPATIVGNIFANASSHGAQIRPGGTVTDNLFVKNPIGLLIGGSASTVSGNVVTEGNDIGTAPRGYGIDINPGTGPIQVVNNIVAHEASFDSGFGITIYSEGGAVDTDTVRNNIIYQWGAGEAVFDEGSGNITSPNAINQTGYLDSNRSVGTYMGSLGGAATLDAFLAVAGNQSKANWNPQLTADAVNNYIEAGFVTTGAISPPTIASFSTDSGTVGDRITNDNTLTLTGSATANSTVKLYDGATLLGSTTANASGAWSYTTSTLSNATHSLTATATNTAGNTSAASAALVVTVVTVDTVAPSAPTIASFSTDTGTVGDGITDDNTLTLTGTAEANSTVKVYDGATQIGTATANGSGAWNYTTGTLSNATHTFSATAMDAAGNTGVASAALAVTVGTSTILGNNNANTLIGTSGNDTMSGLAGNDTLDGLGGTDTLAGGIGDDLYFLRNVGNTISEALGEGTDTAIALVSGYNLAPNLENGSLWVTGTLTGNSLDNALYGNSGNDTLNGAGGNDTLDGLAGTDTLAGGTGNDFYILRSLNNTIIENAGEGTDTVVALVSGHTLSANVENGSLWVTSGGTLTGNSLNNVLYGNSGNDTLNGGGGNDTLDGLAGTDTLAGGTGNDFYVLRSLNNTIIENAGEGTDTVVALVSGYTLSANVENGSLWVTSGGTLTGNSLDNALYGNSGNDTLNGGGGNDTLSGLAGNDILDGGTGNDLMHGGAGNDTFVFNIGKDKIVDFTPGQDVVDLRGVSSLHTFADVQSHAAQVGNDTVITVDANTTLTLQGVKLSDLHQQDFLQI